MRHLVLSQRMGRRLKYLGRLQLRPFLRTAGLGLSDALRWWATELCRDSEVKLKDFTNKYAYDIEHTYGERGHRRPAFAYGCVKSMAFQSPAVGQVHGCPFRNLAGKDLSQALLVWGSPPSAVDTILEMASIGECRQACSKFYLSTHPGASQHATMPHPNAFLENSRQYFKQRASGMHSGKQHTAVGDSVFGTFSAKTDIGYEKRSGVNQIAQLEATSNLHKPSKDKVAVPENTRHRGLVASSLYSPRTPKRRRHENPSKSGMNLLAGEDKLLRPLRASRSANLSDEKPNVTAASCKKGCSTSCSLRGSGMNLALAPFF